jgi:hypothetical protein
MIGSLVEAGGLGEHEFQAMYHALATWALAQCRRAGIDPPSEYVDAWARYEETGVIYNHPRAQELLVRLWAVHNGSPLIKLHALFLELIDERQITFAHGAYAIEHLAGIASRITDTRQGLALLRGRKFRARRSLDATWHLMLRELLRAKRPRRALTAPRLSRPSMLTSLPLNVTPPTEAAW